MARIIVTPDERTDVVLLDEHIYPVHLHNRLSSLHVIERLAWAVDDAEETEQSEPARFARAEEDAPDERYEDPAAQAREHGPRHEMPV